MYVVSVGIYGPKVGPDRLEPHDNWSWSSRSKPTFKWGRTAHNWLCVVHPVFSTLRISMNRLRFRFEPKREKNRTKPDFQTLIAASVMDAHPLQRSIETWIPNTEKYNTYLVA